MCLVYILQTMVICPDLVVLGTATDLYAPLLSCNALYVSGKGCVSGNIRLIWAATFLFVQYVPLLS